MTPLELAHAYMAVFYSDRDAEHLRPLLAPDLRFRGPLFAFDSADDYIRSLAGDDRADFAYRILGAYEDADSACLVYEFSKPGVAAPMAQRFTARDGRIAGILLVFDASAFR